MLRRFLVCLCILIPMSASFSAGWVPRRTATADMPKQAVKVEITILQEGKEPLVLAAKKPELSARSNPLAGENFWRFLFLSNQPIISSAPFTFTARVDPNDLPGGGFYVCSMKKAADKFYFNISGYGGAPKAEFIAQKPTDIENMRNQDGTFTYTVSRTLEPGRYALYFTDNQYAWPFEIK